MGLRLITSARKSLIVQKPVLKFRKDRTIEDGRRMTRTNEIRIATWNVRTYTMQTPRRLQEIAEEALKYKIDIVMFKKTYERWG